MSTLLSGTAIAEPRDRISRADYERLAALILSESGIRLGVEKRTMLEMRVRRRLKALGIGSYREYCAYLFSPGSCEQEIVHLIDAVSTNKTDFFRESRHFDFLVQRALPGWSASSDGSRPAYMVWSAGCSSGEEPYTLGMVLSEFGTSHPNFRFRILASDISTIVLEKAGKGIYSEDTIRGVPDALKRKYFLRSRDPRSACVRAVRELRALVEFRRLNFMDADYGLPEGMDAMDAIFFRNVMIYFDRPTQERILSKLCAHLLPGGYLFVGHSETLHTMRLPLEPVAPSLYLRTQHGR